MILPPTSPIRRMPRREFIGTSAVVRAAPIVDVWPAVPGLSTPPLVVVQIEGERHAVQVTPELFEALADRPPDAHLVVHPIGRMGWVRSSELKPKE